MSRVLVTGANGFVGRPLCDHLLDQGHRVVAAVRSKAGAPDTGTDVVVTGDLASNPDLSGALLGVDSIVHLAARAHVMRDRSTDPEAAFHHANVDATRFLAQQAVRAGVRRFVFLSSVKVNGENTTGAPFTEADQPAPADAYGRSKWAAEQELRGIAGATGLEVVVIRPPLVYGPGVKGNFLRLLRLVRKDLPLPLASVRNRRSLVGVWNLCDLIGVCLSQPSAAGETFLVSDQCDLSTPGLLRELSKGFGKRAHLLPSPVWALRALGAVTGQVGAVERLVSSLQVDSGKASRLLGWSPPVSVQEGLRRTVDWYIRHAGPGGAP
jgi:nucleoside-diphosphate-sugar epimerase